MSAPSPEDGELVPDEIVLVVDTELEVLCLSNNQDGNFALVDCACPTTVAGVDWMKNFIKNFTEERKQEIKFNKSNRMYKFG